MAKTVKKTKVAKRKVQIRDLAEKKADEVKGGEVHAYLKVEGTKQGDIK
jgi:hypothetical protein